MLLLKKNFRTGFTTLPVVTKTFGDWLKIERKRANLTQEDLAKKANNVCTGAYISNLERNADKGKKGDGKPGRHIVDALAKALGVPLRVAREAAGYAAPPESPSESLLIDFSIILSNYERLTPENQILARKLFAGTINTLTEIERDNLFKDTLASEQQITDEEDQQILRETSDEERESPDAQWIREHRDEIEE